MQQANRIFYAMVIFNFVVAANPIKAKVERSKTNTIERSAGRNGKVAGSTRQNRLASAFLCVTLVALESPAFAKAIAPVASLKKPKQNSKGRKGSRAATKAALQRNNFISPIKTIAYGLSWLWRLLVRKRASRLSSCEICPPG
jgi:hypothetical protein